MTNPTADEPASLAEQLAPILVAARSELGLSRRKLAAQLGVSDVALFHYEHGQRNPTLAKAEEIAAAYGVRLSLTAEPL